MKNYKRASRLHISSLNENIHSYTLPNRIRVFTKQIPYLFSTTIGIWLPIGTTAEPQGKEGLAHFLEHLFFKGTKTRTTREIMEAIECKGGQINAFTAQEYTCIYIKTLTEHIHNGIEILSDILINSTFHNLEKEKNVILEEIASLEDSPEENIIDLLHQFIWQNHPLSRPILGTFDSVSQITKRDISSFYKKYYTTNNLIITAVGNFEEPRLIESINRWFQHFPAKVSPIKQQKPPQFHSGVEQHKREISQIHFCLAFPAPAVISAERFICDLATNILGGGSTSRLFYRIREQEGLAYNIFSFHDLFRTAGAFGVYAGVAPENFERVLNLTVQEIQRLKTELVSEQSLDLYREELKGEFLLAHEHASTHMTRIGKSIIYHNQIISIQELLNSYDCITPEEIRTFFQKYCRTETSALVFIGPEKYKFKMNIEI
ncbi:MAG: insulinase family protein [Candidatus Hydrogenedens sp.]|nr:insulinase family protein [Candidatus Hydrogenedens sp.]